MSEKTRTDPPAPICLSLVWHMHQPYYRKAGENELIMPWVRLHAIKDYYDMAALVQYYPKVHQTINLVPSLLEQLLGYADGTYTDRYLRISRSRPEDLSPEDKRFLVERFFDAEVSRMILPYPRYRELYDLRGGAVASANAERLFTVDDVRDLQVWFNLTWFDPIWKERHGDLCHTLVQKGRRFTEEEKQALLDKQVAVMREIVPLHRELQDHGLIEISTTPFYHPILPLLCDTNEARVALPEIVLPARRFAHPEDARRQIQDAVRYYTDLFGRPPKGMWPSEGSVSPAIISLVAEAGIQWIATDEDILAMTLSEPIRRDPHGHVQNPGTLYRPYLAVEGGAQVHVVFRDRLLSDAIGFRYQHIEAEQAAADFLHRLEVIARSQELPATRPLLVSVILDGENCWEYYKRDGQDFLEALYKRLSDAAWISCVTPSEYLARFPATRTLPRLFSGSWIMHNFRVWIGHREDNAAWDLLSDLRDAVVAAQTSGQVPEEQLRAAWQQVYVAEGSDWCWWYGDDRSSGQDDLWDQLFRDHIAHGYVLLGMEVPAKVREPIAAAARQRPEDLAPPKRLVTPVLDGRDTHYFEWYGASRYQPGRVSGVMQAAETHFDTIYAGFDEERLYLRVDFKRPAREMLANGGELGILLSEDADDRFTVLVSGPGQTELFREQRAGRHRESEAQAVVDDVVELAFPWKRIGIKEGELIGIALQLVRGGQEIDTCPQGPTLKIAAPDRSYRLRCWSA